MHAWEIEKTRRLRLLVFFNLLVVMLALSACEGSAAPGTTTENAATVEAPSPAPGPVLTPTRAPAPSTPGPLNLVVWMSDEFTIAPGPGGGDVLTAAVASFQAAFPDIHVALTPKKEY